MTPNAAPGWQVVAQQEIRDLWIGGRGPLLVFAHSVLLSVFTYLAGTSQVMNTYAQQIFENVRREGIFVRVPAGKQMYLYVTHTIDQQQAKVGNLRVTAMPNAAFSQNPAIIHKP